jgi:hypothetical protein
VTQVSKKFVSLCCHPLVNCCSIVHVHCPLPGPIKCWWLLVHILSSKISIASHQTFQGQNRVWRGVKGRQLQDCDLFQDSSHNFSAILIHMFLCFIAVYEISYSAVIYILQYIVHHCSGFYFWASRFRIRYNCHVFSSVSGSSCFSALLHYQIDMTECYS